MTDKSDKRVERRTGENDRRTSEYDRRSGNRAVEEQDPRRQGPGDRRHDPD